MTRSNCVLDWDTERGVLYIHDKETGCTLLRICRLKKMPEAEVSPRFEIDITEPKHVSMRIKS